VRFFYVALLALLLAGCPLNDDSSSSSSATDNGGQTDDGNDGNTDGDSSGDGDDNSGSDGDSSGDGGTTTPLPVDCDWQEPTDVTPAETLGNTSDAAIYSLDGYGERTDLNTDLTGTWVLIHKVTSSSDSANTRNTTILEQKTHFVIRDNAGQLEVSVCNSNGSGFENLEDTSSDFTLPLFGGITQPTFSKTSNSQLNGQPLTGTGISYSNQSTRAIKISSATSAFGQSTLSFDATTESNANTFCFSQRRERTMQQACTADPQDTELSLYMLLGTESGQQGLSYRTTPYYTLNNDNQLMLQTTAPASNSVSASATSVSINIALDDAYRVSGSSATAATGSLVSSLTLP
jgi:hypothetical protein